MIYATVILAFFDKVAIPHQQEKLFAATPKAWEMAQKLHMMTLVYVM